MVLLWFHISSLLSCIYFLFLQSHFLKNRLYLSLPLLYFLLHGSLISVFIKLSSYTALPNCRPFFCLYLTWSCCCILHPLASHSLTVFSPQLLIFLLSPIPYMLMFPRSLSLCWFSLSNKYSFMTYSSSKHFCCTLGPKASWPVSWEHPQHCLLYTSDAADE